MPVGQCVGLHYLPNRSENKVSTIGAHNNLIENGHEQNEKSACCSYETFPVLSSSSGTLEESPIGMPAKSERRCINAHQDVCVDLAAKKKKQSIIFIER